jgi:hypothetical protein
MALKQRTRIRESNPYTKIAHTISKSEYNSVPLRSGIFTFSKSNKNGNRKNVLTVYTNATHTLLVGAPKSKNSSRKSSNNSTARKNNPTNAGNELLRG